MKNHNEMLSAIQLLQHHKIKSKKLPVWHYVLDYTLTGIFLSLYVYILYKIFTI